MKNLLNPIVLRRLINQLIGMQPIHAQVWTVMGGDGLSAPYSYGFSYSYIGAVADTGRQVFRDFNSRNAGNISMKNIVVILPYIAGKPIPRRGDKVILYMLNGQPYAKFWVNHVISYNVDKVGSSTNGIYKHEVHGDLDLG